MTGCVDGVCAAQCFGRSDVFCVARFSRLGERGALVLYRGAFADPGDTTVPEAFLVPSFDLTVCDQAEEAVAEVEESIRQKRPFSVAFIDVGWPPEAMEQLLFPGDRRLS